MGVMYMLKDIRKIEIEGAVFDSSTILDIFNPYDNQKMKLVKGTLIYGRNGTGKSTIAKAFRKLSGEDIPTLTNISVYDNSDTNISLSENDKNHIYVFDEDYVDRNIKLQEDHLETIVILGEAVDLTEKIERASIERDQLRLAYEQQCQVISEYNDFNNIKSPKYGLNQILNALKGDDNWAGRDREINGGRHNTPVKDDTYKCFISLTPSKPKSELIVEYKLKIKELEEAKTGANIIDIEVPSVPASYPKFSDHKILSLLKEEIEKPELSSREEKLFSLLQNDDGNDLLKRMLYFQDEKVKECPYCFQHISNDYKKDLVRSIKKVLNKIVEEHQNSLKAQIVELLDIDLDLYKKLKGYQECIELIKKINMGIEIYNKCLNRKIDNPYESIYIDDQKVRDLIIQLDVQLLELEKARIEYNKMAKKTEHITAKLKRINGEIAYYDIKDLVIQYDKQRLDYSNEKEILDKYKENFEAKKNEVEDLQARRNNVQLAVDAINACLKYIFFAEDRLNIEYVDGIYKLRSHGQDVKPCDISEGERNIIGLSYFFTNILKNKEEKAAYSEEYLIIIDDPISSYDVENRIGILSFLKYKMGMFLEGNINTKMLILTHDLKAYYDIHKIFQEIMEKCKNKGYPMTPKFNNLEMRQKTLMQFSYKQRQEYTELISIIYKYAIGQDNGYDLVIGNMMRQVLEAFSTFEYKKSIEDISTDDKILNLLPAPEYISYYKNLMYRVVLHGGSHREEQIRVMNDYEFFSLISDVEKRRTAKDILCFIYLLNKQHLLQHLQAYPDAEVTLRDWCDSIQQRSVLVL